MEHLKDLHEIYKVKVADNKKAIENLTGNIQAAPHEAQYYLDPLAEAVASFKVNDLVLQYIDQMVDAPKELDTVYARLLKHIRETRDRQFFREHEVMEARLLHLVAKEIYNFYRSERFKTLTTLDFVARKAREN